MLTWHHQAIDETTDEPIVLHDGALTALDDLPAWAEYGVSQMFHMFNSAHDGILCLGDMNKLQVCCSGWRVLRHATWH